MTEAEFERSLQEHIDLLRFRFSSLRDWRDTFVAWLFADPSRRRGPSWLDGP